jgi:hypothetical protein
MPKEHEEETTIAALSGLNPERATKLEELEDAWAKSFKKGQRCFYIAQGKCEKHENQLTMAIKSSIQSV